MSMSYHIETCPTCHRSDAQCVDRPSHCPDPWHGDAHLRRRSEADRLGVPEAALGPLDFIKSRGPDGKPHIHRTATAQANDRSTTIRMRAETSRRCFEDMLAFFVQKYAPEQPYDRDYFQRDLMMLMRDAMQHQSGVFSMHMERTESTMHALSMHASGSLNAIFTPPSKKEGG